MDQGITSFHNGLYTNKVLYSLIITCLFMFMLICTRGSLPTGVAVSCGVQEIAGKVRSECHHECDICMVV